MPRGPRDRVNIRILHSGSKAQDKQDPANHGLEQPYVWAVLWAHSFVVSIAPWGSGHSTIEVATVFLQGNLVFVLSL